METKNCTQCNVEKNIEDFYNKYTECKICNRNRSLKRYHEIKDKLYYQRKLFFEKNRDKLLQKQNSRYIIYRETLRSYVDLENRLKALEEKPHTQEIEY